MANGSTIADANDGLSSSAVYVANDVKNADAIRDALTHEVQDSNIAVVVVGPYFSQENNLSPAEVFSQLRGAHPSYDAFVLSIDGTLYATSRTDAVEAMKIAKQAEQPTGDQQQALMETVVGIEEILPTGSVGAGGSGFDGLLVGLAIGAAVLVAAVVTPIAVIRSRRRRRNAIADAPKQSEFPPTIRADIAALQSFVPVYVAAGSSGKPVARQAARDIDVLATNVGELFTRLGRRGEGGQDSIAATEYDDKLRKLTAALHPEYLLDILRNPHLWDDPDERIDEVQRALAAVSEELLQNIRQVNASRALQFQVSLDGLIGARKELQDWDRDFRDAAGDTA